MSGFAPILRIAPRAAPILLLTLQSGAAFAQAPAPAAVLSSTTSGAAYGQADRLASTLLAGGMSRLTAISAQQGSGSSFNWASPLADGSTHSSLTPMGVHFERFVSKVPTADERAFLSDATREPEVPPSVSSLHFESFPVVLYPNGVPSPSDVNQHAIGDCSRP